MLFRSLYLLDGLGIETGVRLPAVMEASRFLESHLGRSLPSKVLRAGGAPRPVGAGG